MKLQFCCALVCVILLSTSAYAQTAEELIRQAEGDMLSKIYGPAVQKLNMAAQSDRNNPKIYFLLGQCYSLQGGSKNREAIQNLQKAVELDEDYYEAYVLLANLYLESRKGIPKGIKSYEKAYNLQQDPDIKLAYKLRIINEIFEVRKFSIAKQHIEDALALAPDNFDLFFLAAQYYNVIGEFDKTIEMMDKIIADVPEVEGNEQYFYELGYAHFFKKNYSKADEYFDKVKEGKYAKEKRQFTPSFLIEVAEGYYDANDYKRSDEYRTIVVTKDPQNLQAIDLERKLTKVLDVNYSAQIGVLEKQLEANPTDDLLADLARLYYNNGQYDEASATAKQFLSKNIRDLKMSFFLASCEYQLKKIGEGTQTLSDAIKSPKLTPDLKASFGLMLAMVYRSTGDYKMAFKYLQYPFRSKRYNKIARVEKELVFRLIQGGSIEDIDEEGMEEEEEEETDGGDE